MNSVQQYAPTLQKVLLFGLFFVLIFLSFHVLKYFIVPVVWATIIAYMTWPLYQSVQRMCGPRPTLSATIMMILVTLDGDVQKIQANLNPSVYPFIIVQKGIPVELTITADDIKAIVIVIEYAIRKGGTRM